MKAFITLIIIIGLLAGGYFIFTQFNVVKEQPQVATVGTTGKTSRVVVTERGGNSLVPKANGYHMPTTYSNPGYNRRSYVAAYDLSSNYGYTYKPATYYNDNYYADYYNSYTVPTYRYARSNYGTTYYYPHGRWQWYYNYPTYNYGYWY